MKTTGSIVSVNSKSKAAALSAPVKTGDQSGVTSGVVSSVKPAVTTSASSGPVNPAVNSGDAPVDVNLVKPTKGATISSSPGHQVVKTGASSGVRIGVRNKSTVLIGDKGKSIVSGEVGEVISFRDVTFGPHEGEVRFLLSRLNLSLLQRAETDIPFIFQRNRDSVSEKRILIIIILDVLNVTEDEVLRRMPL